MLGLRLGHQPDDDPVMQIDDLISHRCNRLDDQSDHGCVTALRLKLGEISGGHLSTLACDLEKPVLMHKPVDTIR